MACKSQGQKGGEALPSALSRKGARRVPKSGQGMMGLGSDCEAPFPGLRFHLCQLHVVGWVQQRGKVATQRGPDSPKARVPIPAFKLRPRRAEASLGSLQRKHASEKGIRGKGPTGGEILEGARGREQEKGTQERNPLRTGFYCRNNGKPWRVLDKGVKRSG